MKRLKINPIQAAAHMFLSGGFEKGYFSLFGEQRNVHFNGGGGGNPDPDPAKEALLVQIRGLFKTELETRNFANGDAVNAAIAKHLEGLNLDALRAFDQTKIDENIRNIAAEVEKQSRNGVATEKRNAFKDTLAKKMEELEIIHRSGGSDKREITFNTRAAVIMTTDSTADNTDVPDDILDSFSLGAFVEKRRGQQFIYDLATVVPTPNITEYKTWLEEGSEEGAFAIVAEGGLKPLVSAAVVRNVAGVQKIAGKYIVTEEFVKFKKEIFTIIKKIVQQKMVREYNALLTADLIAASVGYTGTILDGTITDANDYDAIVALIAQAQTLNFYPDVAVLHPQDIARWRVTKDAEGRYLFPMTTVNGVTEYVGLTVIPSTYQVVGRITIGESGLFTIEEDTITVRMGYGISFDVVGGNVQNLSHDFDHNRIRMIVEMFFRDYLATNHIGAYITANLATVKAALEAA
jgi:hypothetical protein